jgi:hypothetical protein
VRGRDSEPKVSVVPHVELSSLLGAIAASLDNEMSEQLYTRRHLRLYTESTFYIVKPAQKRFWSRSAAMADADSVLKDLIGLDRG